jgi:hypothetical protein
VLHSYAAGFHKAWSVYWSAEELMLKNVWNVVLVACVLLNVCLKQFGLFLIGIDMCVCI